MVEEMQIICSSLQAQKIWKKTKLPLFVFLRPIIFTYIEWKWSYQACKSWQQNFLSVLLGCVQPVYYKEKLFPFYFDISTTVKI